MIIEKEMVEAIVLFLHGPDLIFHVVVNLWGWVPFQHVVATLRREASTVGQPYRLFPLNPS